jgi:putative FmdB family regulatory protein
MPTYNYKCTNEECKHEFQAVHKMSEPAPPCPKCKDESPEKLISKSSFVLKGSGWFNSGGY